MQQTERFAYASLQALLGCDRGLPNCCLLQGWLCWTAPAMSLPACELQQKSSQQIRGPCRCDMPRVPARSYSFQGGAGAIISAGLLHKVDADELERCVKGLKAPGRPAACQSVQLIRSGLPQA